MRDKKKLNKNFCFIYDHKKYKSRNCTWMDLTIWAPLVAIATGNLIFFKKIWLKVPIFTDLTKGFLHFQHISVKMTIHLRLIYLIEQLKMHILIWFILIMLPQSSLFSCFFFIENFIILLSANRSDIFKILTFFFQFTKCLTTFWSRHTIKNHLPVRVLWKYMNVIWYDMFLKNIYLLTYMERKWTQ